MNLILGYIAIFTSLNKMMFYIKSISLLLNLVWGN